MIARQQKQIGTLTTGLQKVSAQLAAASLSLADSKRANSPQDESAVADLRRKWSTIPGNASGSTRTPARDTISGPMPLLASIGGGVDAGEALAQGEDLVMA